MGIPTLISTSTASNASSVAITSGIDSTYDEYMFVITDYNPATDTEMFTFQVDDDAGNNGYNDFYITSSTFTASHTEDDSATSLAYETGTDLAQSQSYQMLNRNPGNGADESSVFILHLFNPSSTTYVKHFYGTSNTYYYLNWSAQMFFSGYINTTTAINAINFKPNSGNFDAVIQMYGIA